MSSTAVFEHSYYIGNYMSGILYGVYNLCPQPAISRPDVVHASGVELAMYFVTLQACKLSRKKDRFFALYSTALLILLTIDISANAMWGEQMWITFRDAPGGPPAFIAQDLSVWYQIVGSSSVVVLIFMGDAFLVCLANNASSSVSLIFTSSYIAASYSGGPITGSLLFLS
jgi:hypothetical protein